MVDGATSAWLLAHPGAEVTLDVARSTLALPDGRTVRFPLEEFARHCLTHGVDQLGFLLARGAAIEAYEQRQP